MSDFMNLQVAPMANVERIAQMEQDQGQIRQHILQQAAVAELQRQHDQVQKTEAEPPAEHVRDEAAEDRQDSGGTFSGYDQPHRQAPPEQEDETEQPSGKEWVGVILNVKA